MEVTVTPKKETSQADLQITVSAQEFAPYIEKAARKESQDHSIKGFRPGKAPVQVVAQTIGQEHLLHTAMDMALPHFFVQALLDNDVEAINRPNISIEEIGLNTPFRFTATVDVMPEVTLSDKPLKVKKRSVSTDDAEIKKELAFIAKSRSEYKDSAEPAKEGNVVTVDFRVTVDGALIEGGESKNHPVTIGEGHFVPDFENGLIGMKKGETKTFPMSFPEDFPNKEMRGKKAEVTVTMHDVQERIIPELNDEFAKKLGKFESLQHLKDELKKNITKDKEAKEEERYHGELAEKLAENSSYGFIPAILIEKEIDARMEEFAQMLAYQQKTIDMYLAEQKKTLLDVRGDMKEAAEKHVKTGLAMHAFAKKHDIKAEDAEIEEQVNQQLAYYKTIQQAESEINIDDLRERVAATVKNQKTLKKLAEMTEKK